MDNYQFLKEYETFIQYGLLCLKTHKFEEAESAFLKATEIDPTRLEAQMELFNLYNLLVERWHFPMLNDIVRNQSYKEAIQHYLKDEKNRKCVLDIGSGTGILSFFALESGVEKVIACEPSRTMISISKSVATYHGFENKFDIQPKLSIDLSSIKMTPNILVTETFDAGLLGEHILETLDHAHKKLINSDTFIIPNSGEIFSILISSENYLKPKYQAGSCKVGYLNCSKTFSFDSKHYDTEDLDYLFLNDICHPLSKWTKIFSLDFNDKNKISCLIDQNETFQVTYDVLKDGTIHGLGLGFKLMLSPNAEIKTFDFGGTKWENAIYSVAPGVSVKKNEKLVVQFSISNGALIFNGILNKEFSQEQLVKIKDSFLLRELNDTNLIKCQEWLSYRLASYYKKGLKILDTTRTGILSLQVLKLLPSSSISIRSIKNWKSKVSFMCEIATENSLAAESIKVVGSEMDDEKYDIIVTDPIKTDGTLVIMNNFFQSMLNSNGVILPRKVTLITCPIQCYKLTEVSIVKSDVAGFKIGSLINKYRCPFFNDIDLNSWPIEFLSEPLQTEIQWNLQLKEGTLFKSHNVNCRSGVIHGLLFWFVSDYGWEIQLPSKTLSKNMSIFVLETPMTIESDQIIQIKICKSGFYFTFNVSRFIN